MSKFSSHSQLAARTEQIASLKGAAARKQARNNQAAEREHIRLTKKVAHEFDDAFGSGGILKRGLARIKNNSLAVPAERKRELLVSTSGRSFHGKGATYSKKRTTSDGKGRKRTASSGAAHYRYIEDTDHEATKAAASTGSHVAYIDGSRVEATEEGDRLSRTNIDGTFVQRMQFFALAEAFERESHGDKVTLNPNRTSDAMAAALADPACDPAIRAAIESCPLPHNGGPLKIQLQGSNKQLRALLTTHGVNLSTAPKNAACLARDGIAFHTGRSGRTHFRWVFELPKEFTARQRKQVLKGLCAHMDEMKCMYAAVIHAPDGHNDEDNHHIHLIFYDRKCRRLTGTNADLANVAEPFKESIRGAIAAGEIKDGEWDFTVQRHYKSNRSWKIHYPFRAEKSREVTMGKDFKRRFRQEYAAIVNGVSARIGGPAVYDPRSYTDREVDLSPSKHLGQLHALEIAGIPTIIGLGNERNQANDARRSIIARHKEEEARLSALDLKLAPFHPGLVQTQVSNWAAQPLRNLADARLAADAKLALNLWLLETARERSRAEVVRNRQRRAAQKGPARERQKREVLADAAEAYLAQLDAQDAEMLRVVADVQRDIELAPVFTDESIQLNALNSATLRKLFPADAVRTVIESANEVVVAVPSEGQVSPIDRVIVPPDGPTVADPVNSCPLGAHPPVDALSSLAALPDKKRLSQALAVPPLIIVPTERKQASTIDGAASPAPSESRADQAPSPGSAVLSNRGVNSAVMVNGCTPNSPTTGKGKDARLLPLVVSPPHAAIGTLVVKASKDHAGSVHRVADGFAESHQGRGAGSPLPAIAVTPKGGDDVAKGTNHGSLAGPVPSPRAAPMRDTVVTESASTPDVDLSPLGGTNPPRADPGIDTVQHEADRFARIAETVRQACVQRIEKRHVRLIEVDGEIIAAPDQRLERGDASLMAAAQAALRLVKGRQDSLAMSVAEDLWSNAEQLAAGRTDTTDALTLELKDKWASDPAIALAVAQIWPVPSEPAIPSSHEAAFRASRGHGIA